jgi:cytochrome c-type biogenesis protein CcmH
MIWLWLGVALLTLVVIVLLLLPLLRSDGVEGVDRLAYDLTVYRDQLGEIERDRARGLLSDDQAEAARVEVQRRMLAAAGHDDPRRAEMAGHAVPDQARAVPRPGPGGLLARLRRQGAWGMATLAAVAGLVPVGAISLYLVIGSPGMPGLPHAARMESETESRLAAVPAETRDAIQAMQHVVEQTPDDAAAWLELGRLYRQADLHGAAFEALRTARTLGVEVDETAMLLAEMGESLLLSQQGRVSDQVRRLFLDALVANRNEPRARFYLGMDAAQADEPERALAIWRDLSQDSPPDAPWMGMLRQSMMMVAQDSGIMPVSIKPAHPLDLAAGAPVERVEAPAGAGEAAIPQDTPPPAAQPDAGAQMRAEADAERAPGEGFSEDERAMIEGMVSGLAARLEENPDDPDGWLRLARAYGVMGRWDDARAAADRAVEQAPENADILARAATTYLEAARINGEALPMDRVAPLYRAVLEQNPDHPSALFFLGLDAAQTGDPDRARALWGRLLAGMPEDSPARADIQRQLEALPAADAGDAPSDGDADADADADADPAPADDG